MCTYCVQKAEEHKQKQSCPYEGQRLPFSGPAGVGRQRPDDGGFRLLPMTLPDSHSFRVGFPDKWHYAIEAAAHPRGELFDPAKNGTTTGILSKLHLDWSYCELRLDYVDVLRTGFTPSDFSELPRCWSKRSTQCCQKSRRLGPSSSSWHRCGE